MILKMEPEAEDRDYICSGCGKHFNSKHKQIEKSRFQSYKKCPKCFDGGDLISGEKPVYPSTNKVVGPKVEVLLHPNIPKPLHGIAPRTVYGQDWWDTTRHRIYAQAGYRCEACLTPKSEAWPNKWLECHEEYEFLDSGHIIFKNLVALCPACHKFIHSGLRSVLVGNGQLSKSLDVKIQNHGESILKKAGLFDKYEDRNNWCVHIPWGSFRMVIDGKEYGPSSRSYEAWSNGAWRNFKV